MVQFLRRVQYLLADRGETLGDLQRKVGVYRSTLYRRPKSKLTIAAIAYHMGIDAEELVAGTDVEEVWHMDTSV